MSLCQSHFDVSSTKKNSTHRLLHWWQHYIDNFTPLLLTRNVNILTHTTTLNLLLSTNVTVYISTTTRNLDWRTSWARSKQSLHCQYLKQSMKHSMQQLKEQSGSEDYSQLLTLLMEGARVWTTHNSTRLTRFMLLGLGLNVWFR